METTQIATLALIISFISVLIAGISLGWSIRRDLLRPRVKVQFAVSQMATEEGPENERHLVISGTNVGPGEVQLTAIHLKPRWAWLKKIFRMKVGWGYLFRDYRSPYTDQMPCVLRVGDRRHFFLPYHRNCFLKDEKYVGIGLTDSFVHSHWASKKTYKEAQKHFENETWEWTNNETA